MKRVLWIALLPAMLILAAPAGAIGTTQGSPDKVTASAVVNPARESSPGFVIAGPIKEILVKEGEVVTAGQNLVILDNPDLEYGYLQAEAALRAAEFNYQYWIPPRFNRPPERRQLAKAELVIAQKKHETAKAMLAQTVLTAPFEGTIVSIYVQKGELAQPGQPILTIADLNSLQIETTDLSERDIPFVKIGQAALVHIEALNADFNGTVTAIHPKAEVVGGDVVFRVIITLDELPSGLLWGMNAEVEIAAK